MIFLTSIPLFIVVNTCFKALLHTGITLSIIIYLILFVIYAIWIIARLKKRLENSQSYLTWILDFDKGY